MTNLWSFYYKIRGYIQVYIFIGFRWPHVISLSLVVAELAQLVFSLPQNIIGVSSIVTVIGVALFIYDTYEVKRSATDMYSVKLSTGLLDGLNQSEKYTNHRRVTNNHETALYSLDVNQLLSGQPLSYYETGKPFRLTHTAKAVSAYALGERFKDGAVLYNSRKVRLRTDLTPNVLKSSQVVELQRTDYYSSVCTNELTLTEVRSKETGNIVYDGISLMSNTGTILDLDESLCSNHIGISTLAVTSDNKLIVTVQTGTSFIDRNKLVSSASGSADWNDLGRSNGTLQDFIVHSMQRELREECGISETVDLRTIITGHARFLNRGGKPEFFGFTVIDLPSSSLEVSSKEALFIANIDKFRIRSKEVETVRNFLAGFRHRSHSQLSLDLFLNCLFLEDLLGSRPHIYTELIG